MIQRIQSLWLFFSAACAALFIFMPVYNGLYMNNTWQAISIRENLFLLSGASIVTAISFFTIFLFKNRKTQKRLILLNILLTIGLFVAQYYLIEIFKKETGVVQGDWQIIAILPLFILVFHVFAYRGIVADEKLLSSADRMR
jgi:FlaA1/EpsC-like NDP-sugar epimerase